MVEAAFGEVPERVALEEMAYALEAPVWDRGRRTGWFSTIHRMNAARSGAYGEWQAGIGSLFLTIGLAWGVQAAVMGASGSDVCRQFPRRRWIW